MSAVDRALRVLEPLMLDQVRAWRRSLDLSDPDLKRLLEKEILATAHDRLGELFQKVKGNVRLTSARSAKDREVVHEFPAGQRSPTYRIIATWISPLVFCLGRREKRGLERFPGSS